MTLLDRFCAFFAVMLAVVLITLGVPGLFFGCSAEFELPPFWGVIPAIVGIGIIRSVAVAWHVPRKVNSARIQNVSLNRREVNDDSVIVE